MGTTTIEWRVGLRCPAQRRRDGFLPVQIGVTFVLTLFVLGLMFHVIPSWALIGKKEGKG
jgi:hypothetical protein